MTQTVVKGLTTFSIDFVLNTTFVLCPNLIVRYMKRLLHLCVSWERDTASLALPEVS